VSKPTEPSTCGCPNCKGFNAFHFPKSPDSTSDAVEMDELERRLALDNHYQMIARLREAEREIAVQKQTILTQQQTILTQRGEIDQLTARAEGYKEAAEYYSKLCNCEEPVHIDLRERSHYAWCLGIRAREALAAAKAKG
jgi:hypothetical protein